MGPHPRSSPGHWSFDSASGWRCPSAPRHQTSAVSASARWPNRAGSTRHPGYGPSTQSDLPSCPPRSATETHGFGPENVGLIFPIISSHLIGIMISKTIGFRGTLFSDTETIVPLMITDGSQGWQNVMVEWWVAWWVLNHSYTILFVWMAVLEFWRRADQQKKNIWTKHWPKPNNFRLQTSGFVWKWCIPPMK